MKCTIWETCQALGVPRITGCEWKEPVDIVWTHDKSGHPTVLRGMLPCQGD